MPVTAGNEQVAQGVGRKGDFSVGGGWRGCPRRLVRNVGEESPGPVGCACRGGCGMCWASHRAGRGPLPLHWDSSLMECGEGLSTKLFLL